VNHDGFMTDYAKGDFELWNALQARGHQIHPHGFDHADLSVMPFDEVVGKISDCLQYFQEHLKAFDPANVIYHMAYNRSTEEIEHLLLKSVAAVRTNRTETVLGHGLHRADELESRILRFSGHGPDHCDEHLKNCLQRAEGTDAVLFGYFMHGLDDEGWGPIHADALKWSLDYVLNSDNLHYKPIAF